MGSVTGLGQAIIGQLAWSPDGKVLVVGSSDGIRFDTRDELQRPPPLFSDLRHPIGNLAFGRDGRFIASRDADAAIRLWDLQAAAEPTVPPGHHPRRRHLLAGPDGAAGHNRSLPTYASSTLRAKHPRGSKPAK